MLNIKDTTQKEKFNMELQESSDLKHNELAQVRNQSFVVVTTQKLNSLITQ